jgi:hypothetical protein
LSYLEEFEAWRRIGGDPRNMDAKTADAMTVLKNEWEREERRA